MKTNLRIEELMTRAFSAETVRKVLDEAKN